MTDEESDIWFEALSGRAGDDRRRPAREAQALRAALRGRPVIHETSEPARDASREAALIERARQAGLIALPRRERTIISRRRPAGWPALGAIAAACATATVLIVLRPTSTSRPSARTEVVRGPAAEVVTLRAADPLALKRRLLEELRAAGVEATGYERLGAQGIDADLPTPLPDRVRAVLHRHDIALPSDGALRIEILPAGP